MNTKGADYTVREALDEAAAALAGETFEAPEIEAERIVFRLHPAGSDAEGEGRKAIKGTEGPGGGRGRRKDPQAGCDGGRRTLRCVAG